MLLKDAVVLCEFDSTTDTGKVSYRSVALANTINKESTSSHVGKNSSQTDSDNHLHCSNLVDSKACKCVEQDLKEKDEKEDHKAE